MSPLRGIPPRMRSRIHIRITIERIHISLLLSLSINLHLVRFSIHHNHKLELCPYCIWLTTLRKQQWSGYSRNSQVSSQPCVFRNLLNNYLSFSNNFQHGRSFTLLSSILMSVLSVVRGLYLYCSSCTSAIFCETSWSDISFLGCLHHTQGIKNMSHRTAISRQFPHNYLEGTIIKIEV